VLVLLHLTQCIQEWAIAFQLAPGTVAARLLNSVQEVSDKLAFFLKQLRKYFRLNKIYTHRVPAPKKLSEVAAKSFAKNLVADMYECKRKRLEVYIISSYSFHYNAEEGDVVSLAIQLALCQTPLAEEVYYMRRMQLGTNLR
jgi:hypothetical protein